MNDSDQQNSSPRCSDTHQRLSKLILGVYLSSVIFSGFCYPLNHFDWAIWPWKNTWFMFSYAADKMVKIEVYGRLEDDREVQVNMDKWFTYPVAFETARYNEVPRRREWMKRETDYVCQQYNKEALPGQRALSLTFWDVTWEQWNPEKKKRRPLKEAKENNSVTYSNLANYECPVGLQAL